MERDRMALMLQEIRKRRGLTQAELARLSNVNRVAIAKYETGRVMPGTVNLMKLAAALRCSAEELVGKKAG